MADRFDVIFIGAGPGGYIGAIRAAQLGLKTACIEKRATLGGTCLNVGCIPSKALLQSSEHYEAATHKFKRHGIEVGEVSLNLETMLKRKDTVVRQLTQGVAGLFKKNKVEWVAGTATVKSGTEVEVNNGKDKRSLTADHIVIAAGSEPIELPGLKFDGKTIVSSTEALSFPTVPEKLLVVGGGIIGLELGSVWSRLGAEVTVIEYMDDILGTMDKDVTKEMKKILTKQGLKFMLGAKVTGSSVKKGKVTLDVESKDGKTQKVEGDIALVAVGRRPYFEGLGLDKLDIKQDKAGRVEVDDHFRTNVKGVYAIGDLIRGPMLAHKAEEEGVAVAELIAGQAGHVNYEAIPGIVYTWPEVATVGITEQEAKEQGIDYKAGKVPFMANARAKCADETDGFVKVIADAKTDRLLGVHIVGANASEIITEAVMVMEFEGSAEDLGRAVHGHPTLTETIKDAALAVHKRSLNF